MSVRASIGGGTKPSRTAGPIVDLRQDQKHRESPTKVWSTGKLLLALLVCFVAIAGLVAAVSPR
jgi:hypothetical protein